MEKEIAAQIEEKSELIAVPSGLSFVQLNVRGDSRRRSLHILNCRVRGLSAEVRGVSPSKRRA